MKIAETTQYINTVVLVSSITIFVMVFTLLYFVFKPEQKIKIKDRKRKTYPKKTILYMLLATTGITVFISSFAFSTVTTSLFFVCAVSLIPSVIDSETTRIRDEEIFDDVTLYCHNTAMLLKNTHQVFDSINEVKKDLHTVLKEDVEALLLAMQEGKEETKEIMEQMEKNYKYSCIKQLNIIILFMFYENTNINDELLENYQNELDQLQLTIRLNKEERKTLRYQYIFLSIGSLVIYWFFLMQMGATYKGINDLTVYYTDKFFIFLNAAFIFLDIGCLYAANRFFTTHGTTE